MVEYKKAIFNYTSGENKTIRVPIPKYFANYLDINEDNRDLKLEIVGNSIIITKNN